MAVTITIDSLVQPLGELTPMLFPDNILADLLDGWLTDAVNHVMAIPGIAAENQNAAAAAWVYYRAYLAMALRLANEPESITVGPRTERGGSGQLKFFTDLANERLSLFYSFNTVSPVAMIPAFFGVVKAAHWMPGVEL